MNAPAEKNALSLSLRTAGDGTCFGDQPVTGFTPDRGAELIQRLQLAALEAGAGDLASLCLEAAEWVNDGIASIERLLRVIGDEEDDWDAAEAEARATLTKARMRA